MGNSPSSTVSWPKTYKSIKYFHDAAYKNIDEAIRLEEQEKPHEAIEKYKSGVLMIDRAFDVRVVCPEERDSSWDEAVAMIQKLKRARAEVLGRLSCITSSPNFVQRQGEESVPGTSRQETEGGSDEDKKVLETYHDLARALCEIPVEVVNAASRAELIFSCDNVKLYFISPEGTVLQTHKPQTLNIARTKNDGDPSKLVFLQIEDWIYPLIPGVSPCYRTDFHAFVLPDIYSNIPGSSVGIILPEEADDSVYEILESILLGVVTQVSVRRRREIPPATWSDTISNGIVSGGYYVSQGLITGAQKIGLVLNYGTPKLMNFIRPSNQNAEINPNVMRGFEIASQASKSASHFSGCVAEKVGYATQALGKYLAPHVQAQGTRLLSSGFNLSEHEASSKMNGVFTIAAGAIEGFATVYHGLETSASILGNSLSNNTVKIVEYKYGIPAGKLANDTFDTLGNVITISHNAKFFTPKGIVKKAAKEAGKAVVEDIVNSDVNLSPASTNSNAHVETTNALQ